jgi:hypothetical protein
MVVDYYSNITKLRYPATSFFDGKLPQQKKLKAQLPKSVF